MSNQTVQAIAMLERMKRIQSEYEDKAFEMYHDAEKNGAGQFLAKMFVGSNKFDGDPMHMAYYEDMAAASAGLAETLSVLREEDPSVCEEIAAQAVDLLVRPADADHRYLEFIFMADDQDADVLFEFLSTEKMRELWEDFRTHKELHVAVPSQEKSFRLLEDLLRQRGEVLPENGFWQKLKNKLGIIK